MGPSGRIGDILDYIALFGTRHASFRQVLYLGRAPCTKETLPDFREKCRVTRHSRVFRELTGSQRTPGFWASHSRWCRNRKGVVCATCTHSSARQRERSPTTWVLRTRDVFLGPRSRHQFCVATWVAAKGVTTWALGTRPDSFWSQVATSI